MNPVSKEATINGKTITFYLMRNAYDGREVWCERGVIAMGGWVHVYEDTRHLPMESDFTLEELEQARSLIPVPPK